MKLKKPNLFNQLKEYLNSRGEYTELTRKELLLHFYGPTGNRSRETTMDHYRKALCLGGYIVQTDTPGLYVVNVKKIPDDLTLTELNRQVYNQRAR